MQIEPLTGVWVVIRSDGSPVTHTISNRKDITLNLFGNGSWQAWEASGHKCIQVDIEFKPAK